jgi:hypothetical protein
MTGPLQAGWYADRSGAPSVAVAVLQPKDDPFYSDDKPLEDVALGTVLKTRRFPPALRGGRRGVPVSSRAATWI